MSKPSLALPLRVEDFGSASRVYDAKGVVLADVFGAYEGEGVMAHRAAVIKAALEADATKCDPRCFEEISGGESRWMHIQGCPNEERGDE